MAEVLLHVYYVTNNMNVKANTAIVQLNKLMLDGMGVGGTFHGAIQVESHQEQMMDVPKAHQEYFRKDYERQLAECDSKLSGATGLDEKELLTSRKKYLQEKIHELSGRGMTKGSWLGQTLPELRVSWKNVPSAHSSQGRYDYFVPKSVRKWENFSQEAMTYEKEHYVSDVSFMSNGLRTIIAQARVCDNSSAGFVMALVLQYLRVGQYSYWEVVTQPRSGTTSDGKGRDSARVSSSNAGSDNKIARWLAENPKWIEPDLLVEKGELSVLPVEMKPPAVFRGEGGEAVNLVQSYNDVSGARGPLHCECLKQLLTYLVNLKVGYGIVSSAEVTYFVRRVKENDSDHSSLEISEAISFHSKNPTLLEALFLILDKSTTDLESGTLYTFREGVAPEYYEDGAKDDSPEQKAKKGRTDMILVAPEYYEDGAKDDSPEQKAKKGRTDTTFQEGTRRSKRIAERSAVTQSELQCTAAEHLHLERRPHSSGGWSGKIGTGLINDRKVAVKLAPECSKKAEALLKEMTAYKMLERYWGRYVPELVKYGTTVDGTLVFIATELVEGSEFCQKARSQAEWMAAEEALRAIHSSGLLHGDVHGKNIIVVEGGVRVIDFGFSKCITNEADCSKELNQLKTIFEKNCISTVTES